MCAFESFCFPELSGHTGCTAFPHPVLGPARPKHKHGSLLFARSKPAEQLSPTPAASPSDWEAKLERKKSQPSHVGTPPLPLIFQQNFPLAQASASLSFHQLSKTNAQYHKLFKEVSKDELLRQSQSSFPISPQNATSSSLFFRPLTVNVAADRLHVRPAERHPVPGQDVRLRQLDLLPLQSLRQRHQGSGAGRPKQSPKLLPLRVCDALYPFRPDLHPRGGRDLHQENQNRTAGAKCPRGGDEKLSSESAVCTPAVRLCFVCIHEPDSDLLPTISFEARVRVLTLSKHNLQVSQDHLRSS